MLEISWITYNICRQKLIAEHTLQYVFLVKTYISRTDTDPQFMYNVKECARSNHKILELRVRDMNNKEKCILVL